MKKLRKLLSSLLISVWGCSSPDNNEMTTAGLSRPTDESIFTKYQLPTDTLADPKLRSEINDLFVSRRIQLLKLDVSGLYDLKAWKKIYQAEKEIYDRFNYPAVFFTGTTSHELNSFLQTMERKKVVLTHPLKISETVRIPAHIVLDGNGQMLTANTSRVFMLKDDRFSGIENARIEGNFDEAIYVTDGEGILISNTTITNAKKRPVVLMGSTKHFYLFNNQITENGNGGIYIRGNVSYGILEENKIDRNKGTRNFSAGILLSDLDIQDVNDTEKVSWKRIDQRLSVPRNIVILRNQITSQQSSGIYVDGAVSLYIVENNIADNDKEGTCLDNGATGIHFLHNIVMNNGGRRFQQDEDLKTDFVLQFGRMADGSSTAKLPGISLDNAAYNILLENNIHGNYGSGIKAVRTGIKNIIGLNTIADNNFGENNTFHFFGIELSYAPPDDASVYYWNNTGNYQNIVFSNVVQGKHYAGIFVSREAAYNHLLHNIVYGASHWSIESLAIKENPTLNNISDLPSRGIQLNHRRYIWLPSVRK
jgi:parallel beta-helix repeat protein